MQTLLTRSSRTYYSSYSGSSTAATLTINCSFSTVLSATKAATMALATDRLAPDKAADSAPLLRRLGDFYERFYSTMSGASHVGRHHRGNGGGETLTRSPSPSSSTAGGGGSGSGSDRTGRARKAESPVQHFKYSKRPLGSAEQAGNPLFQIHPTLVEKAVRKLSMRLEIHNRLVRALEREIERRKQAYAAAGSQEDKDAHAKEMRALERVYSYITRCFYDDQTSVAVLKAIEASQSRIVGSHLPPFIMRPYLPPFPYYTSIVRPVLLNKAMLNLFDPAVPRPSLLIKVSYNLVTSAVAPDVATFNILLRGFAVYRLNSLAHMVFQCLVESSLVLDDYSLSAIANLCVKSSDFESLRRVIGVLKEQQEGLDTVPSKVGLEALMSALTRFGKPALGARYERTIRRFYPGVSTLSTYTLTSLLKLHTEKRDWAAGMQVWQRLKGLDAIAQREDQPLATDLRAYRQMVLFCRACAEPATQKAVMAEARARGWLADQIFSPVPKTKGVLFTSEIKVPRLVQLTGAYPRYTLRIRKKLRRSHKALGPNDDVLGLLERIFEHEMIFPSLPPSEEDGGGDGALSSQAFLETVVLPWLGEQQPPDKESQTKAMQRSKIWNGIVARRLDILRRGMLAGNEAAGSGGIEWRPDLTAYRRGSE